MSFSYTQFWGYDKGPDGTLVINQEEAKVVREIFALYLQGYSGYKIAKILTERGIKTITGKDTWGSATVMSILKNEKYKGDALLGKTYVADFLTKKVVRNQGEVKQYYVENNHAAIVDPKVFDIVQEEMKRRQSLGHYSGKDMFSSKVICGDCGGFYGPKVWHSNDKYRKVVWQCNRKFKRGTKRCTTPHLSEEQIKAAVISAENKRIDEKAAAISAAEELRKMLLDNEELERKAMEVEAEAEALAGMIDRGIRENMMAVQNQVAYQRKEADLQKRYKEKLDLLEEIRSQITNRIARAEELGRFIDTLREMDRQEEFTPAYWGTLVRQVTVYGPKDIRVEFIDGKTVKA